MAGRDYGQYSGIAQALDLVGERWAMLIVRDLLVGPRRYSELAAGLPRIPTNVLATRLKELQAAGIIRRAPRSRVLVYELTEILPEFAEQCVFNNFQTLRISLSIQELERDFAPWSPWRGEGIEPE